MIDTSRTAHAAGFEAAQAEVLRIERFSGAHVARRDAERTATAAALAFASGTARRYADSWQAAMAESGGTANAARDALRKVSWRTDNIAATETHRAFNEARDSEVERAAREARMRVVRIWDAQLDRRTCEECAGLDGNEYREGDNIPAMPAHNRCRCTWRYEYER